MMNSMRPDAPPKRHPLPGETVVDRYGKEYIVAQRGSKFYIMKDGSWKFPGEVRIKELQQPSTVKKLTPEEEFLG